MRVEGRTVFFLALARKQGSFEFVLSKLLLKYIYLARDPGNG